MNGKMPLRAKRRAARKYEKDQTRENKRKLRKEATRLRRKAIREYGKLSRLSFNPSQASSIEHSCPL